MKLGSKFKAIKVGSRGCSDASSTQNEAPWLPVKSVSSLSAWGQDVSSRAASYSASMTASMRSSAGMTTLPAPQEILLSKRGLSEGRIRLSMYQFGAKVPEKI